MWVRVTCLVLTATALFVVCVRGPEIFFRCSLCVRVSGLICCLLSCVLLLCACDLLIFLQVEDYKRPLYKARDEGRVIYM